MRLIKEASSQKLRGGYYTPPEIASFILHWGINGGTDATVLEPSCGDGVFLEQMSKEGFRFRHVTAVEIEESEARKAQGIRLHDTEVIHADFHRFCLETDRRFDLIVGNPPFIRYQYYATEQQALASEIFARAGLKRTRLANAWMTFVVGCALLLKKKGKLGFVIPSELLQVTYARQLRRYLASHFNKITVISFRHLVFETLQQDIVLLLCEKDGADGHLTEHVEVKDATDLWSIDLFRLKHPEKPMDPEADKWTCYCLDRKELEFLESVRRADMSRIGTYSEVEVGITTGANAYFTVPQDIVERYQLHPYARPMVGRSVQVHSLCFSREDWQRNLALGTKANLLVFPENIKKTGGDGVKAYIGEGEKQGVDKGYKTGIRDDWYVLPSVKRSDAFFLRRSNFYPKLIFNAAQAYATDTMHRVFIKDGINHRAFVASYYNSLSWASAEILGRNFGGGVLELMPSETEEVYLPYRAANEELFDCIDCMMRRKLPADAILDFADEAVLRRGMGFTKKETGMARGIWRKLMERRLNRKKKGRSASM